MTPIRAAIGVWSRCMPRIPRSIVVAYILFNVAIAITVKRTPAPLMIICWSKPASTPVDALMLLKSVAPK